MTGQDYESAVQSLVLRPCGIARMRLGRSLAANRAEGEVTYYEPAITTGERPLARSVFDLDQRVPWPYGGFCLETMDAHGGWIGSAVDLTRFVTALEGSRGAALLKPDTLKLMTAPPTTPVPPAQAYYGLGWSIRPVGKSAHWWHAGSLPGSSTLLVRTASGRAWALLFNARPRDEDFAEFQIQLDRLPWQAVEAVQAWPRGDLFGQF